MNEQNRAVLKHPASQNKLNYETIKSFQLNSDFNCLIRSSTKSWGWSTNVMSLPDALSLAFAYRIWGIKSYTTLNRKSCYTMLGYDLLLGGIIRVWDNFFVLEWGDTNKSSNKQWAYPQL